MISTLVSFSFQTTCVYKKTLNWQNIQVKLNCLSNTNITITHSTEIMCWIHNLTTQYVHKTNFHLTFSSETYRDFKLLPTTLSSSSSSVILLHKKIDHSQFLIGKISLKPWSRNALYNEILRKKYPFMFIHRSFLSSQLKHCLLWNQGL